MAYGAIKREQWGWNKQAIKRFNITKPNWVAELTSFAPQTVEHKKEIKIKDLNPVWDYLQATSPENQGASYPRFFVIRSPLIQATNALGDEDTSVDLPTMAPSKRFNELPDGGKEASTIDLMILMSTLGANQNTTPEENADQKAATKNIAPEQKGCTTLLKDLSLEHPFCAIVSGIFLTTVQKIQHLQCSK
ncbi:hypothetical protein DSO57_1005093 [Entomophthora muscae]|uniref:Uncharacterized protein n=1 Tax=Entomophthora muscae TaxID=34485 RepID=A0ACC2RN35_9FUNG|nr:hypothetical protein DSO57_1005093 [Entomophthora muscae]